MLMRNIKHTGNINISNFAQAGIYYDSQLGYSVQFYCS